MLWTTPSQTSWAFGAIHDLNDTKVLSVVLFSSSGGSLALAKSVSDNSSLRLFWGINCSVSLSLPLLDVLLFV